MNQTPNFGPVTPEADAIHAAKYRGRNESFREAVNRVANALCDGSAHYGELREILGHQRWSPGGRIWSAMGASKTVTASNCFVSGEIEDTLLDGGGSIMNRLVEAVTTLRLGGGIGYDFSNLRPEGALIRKLGSQSCGPVRFMEMYDGAAGAISSTGERRGAQMAMLRIDHPDVETFIRAKQRPDYLTRFNLSIQVTDEFMEALAAGRSFKLRHEGQVYREVDSAALWDMLMRSNWDWGEPGVFFVDRVNRANNLGYCEKIIATNPCGEVPLPPFGACLLGSFNLVKYLVNQGTERIGDEVRRRYGFDWELFAADVPPVVRAMDNVGDRTTWPLFEQEREYRRKRRIGLGVTGLANAGEALGHPYGSAAFCAFEERVLRMLRDGAYRASSLLAREKGAFPLFNLEAYEAGEQFQGLDEEVQDLVRRNGLRNSHLLSIAPTGTISLCMDNVSSSIEPVFVHEAERVVRFPDGERTCCVTDFGYAQLGVAGRIVRDVTVDEHIAVLATAAPLVDQSISKTINVSDDVTWEQFKGAYQRVYEAGCKSCTVFRPAGKRAGILRARNTEEAGGEACLLNPESGVKECA